MSESTLLIGLLGLVVVLYLSVGAIWGALGRGKTVVEGGGEKRRRTPAVVRLVRVGLIFAAAVIGLYLYFPVPAKLGTELSGTYAQLRPVLRGLDAGGAAAAADVAAKRKQAVELVEKLKGLTAKATIASMIRGGADVAQQVDGLSMTLDRVGETVELDGAQLATDNDLMMLQVRQLQKMLGGTEAAGAMQGNR